MASITPAIISDNFSGIKNRIGRLEGLAPWAHLDIMDGLFVVPTTWHKPDDLKAIPGQIKIEAHLMIEKPEEFIPLWRDNADRIIFHLEAAGAIDDIIESFNGSVIELGIALELQTPVEEVFPYVDRVSLIHLMSIAEIGYHGKPFAIKVLAKIKTLRDKFPSAIIQVDGGINLETGKLAMAAGANKLSVGSALWQSKNMAETIAEFAKI